MSKVKEFVLQPGRLWPDTPSGNPLEIELFGATGEFQVGKTVLGGSIAPGKHPEGHPFAGKPRTLYLDLEKSGATYGGIGWQRIDVPAEMAKLHGTDYTAKQVAEWFNSLPGKLKPGQFDVILVDPVNDIESGQVDIVRADPGKHGYTKGQFDGSVALLMAAMKAHWKKLLMSFSNVCKCFYFTTHLRDEFKGGKPSGKREPRGKETLAELASLYLWLERAPDEKGNVAAAPSAIVLKQRLADTTMGADGNLVITALMPPRIPLATVAAIRSYIANPPNYGKLTEAERFIEKSATEEEMLRLKLATAEAETKTAQSRIDLLDRQQQLVALRTAAVANVPQAMDRTAANNQAAEAKRQADANQAAIEAANAALLTKPETTEERAANTAHRAAAAQLADTVAKGEKILAKAEGDHATARDVAKEVQSAKNPTAAATQAANAKATNGTAAAKDAQSAAESRSEAAATTTPNGDHATRTQCLEVIELCKTLFGEAVKEKLKALLDRAGVAKIAELKRADCLLLVDKLKTAVARRNVAAATAGGGVPFDVPSGSNPAGRMAGE